VGRKPGPWSFGLYRNCGPFVARFPNRGKLLTGSPTLSHVASPRGVDRDPSRAWTHLVRGDSMLMEVACRWTRRLS
jgi:hypothetical protein